MAMTDKASTKDRLLDAAAELFYRDGVSIGVEALCRTAGVSKRSMYQLFASKDEVLAASLARQLPAYEAQLAPGAQDAARPGSGSCLSSSGWRRPPPSPPTMAVPISRPWSS